jgi:hypothetical protein
MDSIIGSYRSLGVIVVLIVIGLVALNTLFKMLRAWQQSARSQSWSQTTGTVQSANVVAGRNPGRNGVSYYPVVMYEYNVDGQRYIGNRIHFGSQVGIGIQSIAARGLNKYPVGGTVPVYYNPENPADAVLQRSAAANWGNYLMLAILIIAIIIIISAFGPIRLPFAR